LMHHYIDALVHCCIGAATARASASKVTTPKAARRRLLHAPGLCTSDAAAVCEAVMMRAFTPAPHNRAADRGKAAAASAAQHRSLRRVWQRQQRLPRASRRRPRAAPPRRGAQLELHAAAPPRCAACGCARAAARKWQCGAARSREPLPRALRWRRLQAPRRSPARTQSCRTAPKASCGSGLWRGAAGPRAPWRVARAAGCRRQGPPPSSPMRSAACCLSVRAAGRARDARPWSRDGRARSGAAKPADSSLQGIG
jgi:hypothetical protein